MGHVDERDPDLLLDSLELDLHLFPELQVERAEGLIEEEDRRPVHERPGEGDALGLAAGDLVRAAVLEAGQLHQVEHLGDPGLDVGVRNLLTAEAEGDVLVDRQVGKESVVLEDRVDVPLVRREPGDVAALELDLTRGRLLEPADHPEGRGLAAAGRTEEAEELALADLEVDMVDGEEARLRVGLAHRRRDTPSLGVAAELLRELDQPDSDVGQARRLLRDSDASLLPPVLEATTRDEDEDRYARRAVSNDGVASLQSLWPTRFAAGASYECEIHRRGPFCVIQMPTRRCSRP